MANGIKELRRQAAHRLNPTAAAWGHTTITMLQQFAYGSHVLTNVGLNGLAFYFSDGKQRYDPATDSLVTAG